MTSDYNHVKSWTLSAECRNMKVPTTSTSNNQETIPQDCIQFLTWISEKCSRFRHESVVATNIWVVYMKLSKRSRLTLRIRLIKFMKTPKQSCVQWTTTSNEEICLLYFIEILKLLNFYKILKKCFLATVAGGSWKMIVRICSLQVASFCRCRCRCFKTLSSVRRFAACLSRKSHFVHINE